MMSQRAGSLNFSAWHIFKSISRAGGDQRCVHLGHHELARNARSSNTSQGRFRNQTCHAIALETGRKAISKLISLSTHFTKSPPTWLLPTPCRPNSSRSGRQTGARVPLVVRPIATVLRDTETEIETAPNQLRRLARPKRQRRQRRRNGCLRRPNTKSS